jgi:hypothetical protein
MGAGPPSSDLYAFLLLNHLEGYRPFGRPKRQLDISVFDAKRRIKGAHPMADHRIPEVVVLRHIETGCEIGRRVHV